MDRSRYDRAGRHGVGLPDSPTGRQHKHYSREDHRSRTPDQYHTCQRRPRQSHQKRDAVDACIPRHLKDREQPVLRQTKQRPWESEDAGGTQVLQPHPGDGGQPDPSPRRAAGGAPVCDNGKCRRVQGQICAQQDPGQQPENADPRQNTGECYAPGQIAESERVTHRAPVDREDERCEGHPGEPAGIKRRKTQDQKETGENRKGRSSQSPQSTRSSQSKLG